MARLYIVRHGNTFDTGDTVTRVGARTDLPLSVSGREQARKLAAHFASIRFSAALCSTLVRTRQTARAILSARTDNPALLVAPFLTEIDYGPDENQPEEVVAARLGAALEAWDRDGVPPPGWQVDVAAIRAGWSDLLARAAGLAEDAAALLVTSNGIARFLPDVVDKLPEGLDRKLKTGAWGELTVTSSGSELLSWNQRP
ncbi:MAG: histidine phosphatase family protein [Alphaproteobacteria bacterium HGW-Alphaproteobacteria-18]|nr:MAG: histidine phosphatase family protein [Alphaproteobacteria bacterium HGW-Alphaproteobacteria-18]